MLMLSAFLFVLGIQAFAQDVMPEITVTAVRYKYLSAVNQKELAQPVKMLERQAAEYNVKKSEYYEDEYDNYFISFFIPQGEILATYDQDGKLLRTAGKFKNVSLPMVITQAVKDRFPQWRVAEDAYLVNYYEDSGAKKVYKLTLQNGDKRLKVKLNEKGEFIG
jgi:hypothetical protein